MFQLFLLNEYSIIPFDGLTSLNAFLNSSSIIFTELVSQSYKFITFKRLLNFIQPVFDDTTSFKLPSCNV